MRRHPRSRLSRRALGVLSLFFLMAMAQDARADVSQGDSTQLEIAGFSQAAGNASSSNFQQAAAVSGGPSSDVLSSPTYKIVPGIIGALHSGNTKGIIDALEEEQGALDITVLYARTSPIGTTIDPEAWQLDADPIYLWEPPSGGLDVAGYSYAFDTSPDEVVDTTKASFDVEVEMTGMLGDGVHSFWVRAVSSSGVGGEPIAFTIWVDTTSPTVSSYAPNPGSLLSTATPRIAATLYESGSGINASTIDLQINSSSVPVLYDPVSGLMTTSWAGAFREGANSLELNVSDVLGNTAVPLLWSVTIDTVAPTGIIIINSGAAMTTSMYVALGLSAQDAVSGIAAMKISNEPFTGYVQETYVTVRKLWSLTPITGGRRVYVIFVDKAGNESTPIYDEIELTLFSPETVIMAGPAGFTPQQSALFAFLCPEGSCVFSYAFDNAEWSPWSSQTEVTLGNLKAGNHYFRVKAAKEFNGVEGIQLEEEDPSPAQRSWIVTFETPQLMIPFGPPIKLWRID